MTLKNILAVAICLCLGSVVACQQEQRLESPLEKGLVSLTLDSGSASASKTWMDANTSGAVLPVYWSDGDQIAVNGITSDALEIGEGQKVKTATFKVRNVSSPFRILYPASALKSIDENYAMTVAIPDEQVYAENSFANGSAVLCAYSESDPPVILENCCGAVCVCLKDVKANVIKDLTLTSLGDEIICGDFKLDVKSALLTPVSGGNSVRMAMPAAGVKLDENGQKFIFTIPAGSYPKGFSLRFMDERKHVLRCFWLRKSKGAEPGVEVKSGTVVFFEAQEYQPDAREITNAEDWNEFAAAYNAGNWEEDWLGKDGTIKITADFSAESLTSVNEFKSVLDAGGHTITRTSGTTPLFGTVSGKICDLTLAGKMTPADPGNAGAAVFTTNLTAGGSFENCVNKTEIVLSTSQKTVAGAFARTMSGGKLANCTNDGNISLSVNVNSADQPVVIGGLVATIPLTDNSATIENCVNNGSISLTIVKDASAAKRPVQAGYGGIVGTYVSGEGSNFLTIDRCTNNAPVKVTYSASPTASTEFISGTGGIIGCALKFNSTGTSPWFKTGRPTESELTSEDCVYMVMRDCVNNGDIASNLIGSCSSDNVTKSCCGGLAGVLNGLKDQHIEVTGCSTFGKVIPTEMNYSRSTFCSVAGGLTGYGAYVDFTNCTVKSDQIGTVKRQTYSAAGAIGYAVAAFKLESCKIFANVQMIRCTTYTPGNYAIGFNLSTQKNTDGGVWPVFIMIDCSSVTNCKFGGTFTYNSATISSTAPTPKADKTETITASTVDARIPSASFSSDASYASKVKISNNSYWDGK